MASVLRKGPRNDVAEVPGFHFILEENIKHKLWNGTIVEDSLEQDSHRWLLAIIKWPQSQRPSRLLSELDQLPHPKQRQEKPTACR